MRRMMMLALCVAWPFALLSDTNGGGVGVQTIKVSSVSPLLTLKFWDYDAEDGDWVRIDVNGEKYREFELMHTPKTVSIPILFSDSDEVFVNVVGTQSGSGPVTYAVQATGLGSSTEVYKNSANVGLGNSYRIIKTKDDIFSIGVGFLGRLFGMDEEKNLGLSEAQLTNLPEQPIEYVGNRMTITLLPQEIVLPTGESFTFDGGTVSVEIVDMGSWEAWIKDPGIRGKAENVGAYSYRNHLWGSADIYIRDDTTWEEVIHECIHILNKDNAQLEKYKDFKGDPTKNEEYLAYMISRRGKSRPDEIVRHIDNDSVYDQKEWVEW